MNSFQQSTLIKNFKIFKQSPVNDSLYRGIYLPKNQQILVHLICFERNDANVTQKISERVRFLIDLKCRHFAEIIDFAVEGD